MSSSLHKQLLGNQGEEIAAQFLRKQGYLILERNFKKHYGEIDIIAVAENVLVFVEVKTRIGHAFGTPEEAVTPRKLREVIKTAEYYAMTHENLPASLRVDVIAIELNEKEEMISLKHILNVTQ